jgi:hypothetical protein
LHWLASGRLFSPGTPVSSTNKTDRHDITEILLKVALNTTTLTLTLTLSIQNKNSGPAYFVFIMLHYFYLNLVKKSLLIRLILVNDCDRLWNLKFLFHEWNETIRKQILWRRIISENNKDINTTENKFTPLKTIIKNNHRVCN